MSALLYEKAMVTTPRRVLKKRGIGEYIGTMATISSVFIK
jgi:hypothetical protein